MQKQPERPRRHGRRPDRTPLQKALERPAWVGAATAFGNSWRPRGVLTDEELAAIRAAERAWEDNDTAIQAASEQGDGKALARLQRKAERDLRDAREDVVFRMQQLAADEDRDATLRAAAVKLLEQLGAAKLAKAEATVSTATGLVAHDLEGQRQRPAEDDELTPAELAAITSLMKRAWSEAEMLQATEDLAKAGALKDTPKFERCVQHVKAGGHDVGAAHAICYTALGRRSEKQLEANMRKNGGVWHRYLAFDFQKGSGKEEQVVIGIATSEAVDQQDEIVDPEAFREAVADFMQWANLREMHENKAAGVVLKLEPMEGEVEIGGRKVLNPVRIVAKVVDPEAWAKVKAGVYKGFSIGGKVLDWVTEQVGGKLIRRITKLLLTEISLVDRPANPDATILVAKRAGLPEGWREEPGKMKMPKANPPSETFLNAARASMRKAKPGDRRGGITVKANDEYSAEERRQVLEAVVRDLVPEAKQFARTGNVEYPRGHRVLGATANEFFFGELAAERALEDYSMSLEPAEHKAAASQLYEVYAAEEPRWVPRKPRRGRKVAKALAFERDGDVVEIGSSQEFYRFAEQYPLLNDPNFREVVQVLLDSDVAERTGNEEARVKLRLERKGEQAIATFTNLATGKGNGAYIVLTLYVPQEGKRRAEQPLTTDQEKPAPRKLPRPPRPFRRKALGNGGLRKEVVALGRQRLQELFDAAVARDRNEVLRVVVRLNAFRVLDDEQLAAILDLLEQGDYRAIARLAYTEGGLAAKLSKGVRSAAQALLDAASAKNEQEVRQAIQLLRRAQELQSRPGVVTRINSMLRLKDWRGIGRLAYDLLGGRLTEDNGREGRSIYMRRAARAGLRKQAEEDEPFSWRKHTHPLAVEIIDEIASLLPGFMGKLNTRSYQKLDYSLANAFRAIERTYRGKAPSERDKLLNLFGQLAVEGDFPALTRAMERLGLGDYLDTAKLLKVWRGRGASMRKYAVANLEDARDVMRTLGLRTGEPPVSYMLEELERLMEMDPDGDFRLEARALATGRFQLEMYHNGQLVWKEELEAKMPNLAPRMIRAGARAAMRKAQRPHDELNRLHSAIVDQNWAGAERWLAQLEGAGFKFPAQLLRNLRTAIAAAKEQPLIEVGDESHVPDYAADAMQAWSELADYVRTAGAGATNNEGTFGPPRRRKVAKAEGGRLTSLLREIRAGVKGRLPNIDTFLHGKPGEEDWYNLEGPDMLPELKGIAGNKGVSEVTRKKAREAIALINRVWGARKVAKANKPGEVFLGEYEVYTDEDGQLRYRAINEDGYGEHAYFVANDDHNTSGYVVYANNSAEAEEIAMDYAAKQGWFPEVELEEGEQQDPDFHMHLYDGRLYDIQGWPGVVRKLPPPERYQQRAAKRLRTVMGRGNGKVAKQEQDFDAGEDSNPLGVREGDLVDFGNYGRLYVVSLSAGIFSHNWWVTDREEDRDNPDARGWYIKPGFAERIVERYQPEEGEEGYNEEGESLTLREAEDLAAVFVQYMHPQDYEDANQAWAEFWTELRRDYVTDFDAYDRRQLKEHFSGLFNRKHKQHEDDLDKRARLKKYTGPLFEGLAPGAAHKAAEALRDLGLAGAADEFERLERPPAIEDWRYASADELANLAASASQLAKAEGEAVDDATVVHNVIRTLAVMLSDHGDEVAGQIIQLYGGGQAKEEEPVEEPPPGEGTGADSEEPPSSGAGGLGAAPAEEPL